MGYIRHHAIMVTTFEDKLIVSARKRAVELFGDELVSDVLISPTNRYVSIFIAPDGSKEGWGESIDGDSKRATFKVWLKSQRYEDGSSPYSWAEVQYGDDEWETKIVDDSEAERRAQKEPE